MCTLALRVMLIASAVFASTAAISGEMDVCQAKRLGSQVAGERGPQGRILGDGMHRILVLPDQCPDDGYLLVQNEADDSHPPS